MVTTGGQVSPWFRVHRDVTRELRVLGQRLNIDPRSRAKKAPKTVAGPVSYYERMDLEGWNDSN
jgi:hypothetical protein